ncbi:type II toxin-antitoxin system RelE/ParE family toxin, partial [Candidatus Entotheonella palauensis]|uniref:type II toxin-antitoxin system RelE/ParE family toxin n=1 Tax=Candidatus Entotheonella palauensis TaxID=93172 RepID=UPI0011788A60
MRLRPRFLRDLIAERQRLIEYALRIAEDNPEAAERFLVAAEESVERLASMPLIGRTCEFRPRSWDRPLYDFRGGL